MATNISIIYISAPLSRVWDTLTQPELVKLWQFGSELQTSWEPGTSIRFRTEWEGKVFEQWGTVLEVREQELVRYSLFAPRPDLEDRPENYFTMSYIIAEDNGRVRLEIIQEDNRPGAVQEAVQGEENPVLQTLKQIAEA